MLSAQHAEIASRGGQQMLKAKQLIRICLGSIGRGIERPLEQFLQMIQFMTAARHESGPRCIEQRHGRSRLHLYFSFR